MTLYLKHRPNDFPGVLGNVAQIKSLKVKVTGKEPPHAYMISGPRGIGKTTLARICSDKLGVHKTSYFEFDCAKSSSVEDVRAAIDNMQFLPFDGNVSVYVFDEFHRASPQAQEAMLKTLEDTPPHVFVFICTSKPKKIDSAVVSRCLHIKLKALVKKTLEKVLTKIAVDEDMDETIVSEEVISEIAKNSEGSARIAIQLLDQVSGLDTEDEALDVASDSIAEDPDLYTLYLALCNSRSKWKDISAILTSLKETATGSSIYYGISNMASNALLKKDNSGVALVLDCFSEIKSEDIGMYDVVLTCYRIYKQGAI